MKSIENVFLHFCEKVFNKKQGWVDINACKTER